MPERQPPPSIDATALLVLGMHRSGTSAIAGALAVLGVPLGSRLIDAGPDNLSGYWEQRDAVLLDEHLLRAFEMDWDDPRELPSHWLDSAAATQAGGEIRTLAADEFRHAPLWALKDPRLCRLLPLWRRELAAVGVQPAALLVLRHPDEIAASLLARDALPPAVAHLLLIRHLLEAERASRDMPRAVASYQRVLEDPAVAFARIAVDLGLLWPQPPAKCSAALDAFLNPEARHHAVGALAGLALDSPFRATALELHALLERGVPDVSTRSALDTLREQFEAELSAQQPWLDTLYAECRLRATARARLAQRHADQHALLQQRVHDTEAAQQRAEALSLQRLEELAQHSARLREADAALAQQAVEAQARLLEAARLDRALGAAQQAQQQAATLALQRLAEAQRLDRALGAAQRAQQQAAAIALQRLDELGALNTQLAQTQTALAGVEALCVQRLHEIERLDTELLDTRAQLQQTSADLARIHASRWWRIGAPLRSIARWWQRVSARGAAR